MLRVNDSLILDCSLPTTPNAYVQTPKQGAATTSFYSPLTERGQGVWRKRTDASQVSVPSHSAGLLKGEVCSQLDRNR